jgi:hypothetical protein
VARLLIGDVFPQDAPPGFVDGIFSRLEALKTADLAELGFWPAYRPGPVDLIREDADLGTVQVPFVVADVLEDLRDRRRPITVSSLVSELRTRGYDPGPERERDLEQIVHRLFVAGHLEKTEDHPSEDAMDRREARRRAALRMWWSR